MKAAVIDGLLAVLVLSTWLGVLAFLRLRNTLDRLHCVTFVNVVCGLCVVVAAFVADGLADRPLKILVLAVVTLINGAGLSHAVGRALWLRWMPEQAKE